MNPLIARNIYDFSDLLYGVFAVCIGVWILVNSDAEGTSPAFVSALTLPGGIHTMGWLILVFGVILLIGAVTRQRLLLYWGSFWCCAWCGLYAIAFLLHAIDHEGAGGLGFLSWGFFSVLYAMHAVVRTKRFEQT